VLQHGSASFGIELVLDQPKLRSAWRVGQKWDAAAENDWDDRDRDSIDEPELKQAPEERPTTEKPDVLARLLPQRRNRLRRIV
jgi:hypothetical protein